MNEGEICLPCFNLNATMKSRMNLSLHHMFAACRFATKIGEIECQNQSQPFGVFWEEILHYALGVAMLTVACIEGYANELYFEPTAVAPTLNPAAATLIADLLDREPILQKYSAALTLRHGTHLDFGIPAVQNADALIKLRNSVVHFRPEWYGEQNRQHEKLSKKLQHKFATSQFLPDDPVFPRAWASHDFAKWALKSTVAFLKHFYEQAGIVCPLSQFDSQLTELSGNVL